MEQAKTDLTNIQSHRVLLWHGAIYWWEDCPEITFYHLGLKPGFIFTPIYHPDCSRSLCCCCWCLSSCCNVDCQLELDWKCTLPWLNSRVSLGLDIFWNILISTVNLYVREIIYKISSQTSRKQIFLDLISPLHRIIDPYTVWIKAFVLYWTKMSLIFLLTRHYTYLILTQHKLNKLFFVGLSFYSQLTVYFDKTTSGFIK